MDAVLSNGVGGLLREGSGESTLLEHFAGLNGFFHGAFPSNILLIPDRVLVAPFSRC